MQAQAIVLFPHRGTNASSPAVTFAKKNSTMPTPTTISDTLYADLAAELLTRIGPANYFNGSVEINTPTTHYRLITTLLIYRDGPHIRDIVPVWWELRAQTATTEIDTDFDWSDFRTYLL